MPSKSDADEHAGSLTPVRIVVYTRPGCEDSEAARQFLKQRQIRFEEVNVDKNLEALRFVRSVNQGKERTPTFEVDCRVFHCSPFDARKLARELGLPEAAGEACDYVHENESFGRKFELEIGEGPKCVR